MSNILTVFGASGNQGGSIIRSVLADPELSKSFQILTVTRDTKKPAIKALEQQGVEVVSVSGSDSRNSREFLVQSNSANTCF